MAGPKLTTATIAEQSLILSGGFRRPDGRANRGNAAAPVTPPSPTPTNIPSLSVQSTAVQGDNVPVTATTSDSDGFTTTGVTLYNGITSLGTMTNTGGGSWALTLNGITAGTYSLFARRITASGTLDSTPAQSLIVRVNVPGNVQVDTTSGNIQVDTTTGNVQVEQ